MWHAHNLCQIFFCFVGKSPLLFTITKTEATAEKVFGKGSQNRCVEPKTAVNEPSDRSAAPKTAVNESSDRSDRLKGGSKNSGFKFLPILMFSISAAFRPFRCHFVKSHQSHSPLCSFFNLQKHTQKKNENQLDIIFRTTLKTVV